MRAKQTKRLTREHGAATFAEANHDPMVALFFRVSTDLREELEGVGQFQADARIAAEMAYQLDQKIVIPNEIGEALDYFVYFLASLVIIGVVRSLQRSSKRRKDRLMAAKRRMKDRGPHLTALSRRALERRIARLEAATK